MKISNIKMQNDKPKFKKFRLSVEIYKHEHEPRFEINFSAPRVCDP